MNKVYIETYGCQMNVADSEVVVSILNKQGFGLSDDYKNADLSFYRYDKELDLIEEAKLEYNVFRRIEKS